MLKFKWETEFKETEIGEIPSEWKTSILGEEHKFSIIMGQSPPSRYYNQDRKGMPFIQGKTEFEDLYIKTNTYTAQCSKIAPPNSVLITVRAPVGELNITKSELCIGRGVAAIFDKSKDPLQNRFVFYMLKGLKEHLSMLGERGTTYDSITKEELDNLPFPNPPASEQSRSASVLSWFDDLIENKKRQNEILEKTAMAVFKSWFVDFEPFSDSEFVDSALGKMPKNWGIGKLSDVCEIIMGQSPPSEYYNREGEGPPFIQGKGQFGRYTPNTDVFCSGIGKRAKPKDILLTVRAPIGELNVADAEYIIGRGLASLRSETWVFVYLYLLSNKELLKASERGTIFDAITKPELESFPVVKPPRDVLEKFKAITEHLFSKILLNQKQILVLSKVRDVLLPLLVFGKLRVEEI
jgi:type I restriction enzyme S subunit